MLKTEDGGQTPSQDYGAARLNWEQLFRLLISNEAHLDR